LSEVVLKILLLSHSLHLGFHTRFRVLSHQLEKYRLRSTVTFRECQFQFERNRVLLLAIAIGVLSGAALLAPGDWAGADAFGCWFEPEGAC